MLKLSILILLFALVNCTDSTVVIEADLVKSLSNTEDDEEVVEKNKTALLILNNAVLLVYNFKSVIR